MVQVQIHDCHIVYQFWSFNSYSASEHVCVKNLQEWAFVGCIVIVPYRANHNDEVQKPPEYMKCSCFASTMTISTTILQNDCCKILSQLLHRECSDSWNFTALYCISTLIACRSKITKMFFYQTHVNAYSKAFPKYKVCNPWWESTKCPLASFISNADVEMRYHGHSSINSAAFSSITCFSFLLHTREQSKQPPSLTPGKIGTLHWCDVSPPLA